MKRILFVLLLAVTASGLAGCAICCTPYDYDYSAYGGRWQRSDMIHGRVGSAFSPAGMQIHETPVLVPPQVMPDVEY